MMKLSQHAICVFRIHNRPFLDGANPYPKHQVYRKNYLKANSNQIYRQVPMKHQKYQSNRDLELNLLLLVYFSEIYLTLTFIKTFL